ncbi:MAG: recombinase RecT [Syntrophales bacterium]|nr:recombinase RecT [Syntrophales bacterium]
MATGNSAQAKQAPAAPPAPPVKQESPLALMKRTVVDAVAHKVGEFVKNREIDLPAAYSVGNALKAAWLILQETKDKDGKKALEVCTKDSIANCMLDMVVQGLNPIKNQVYFIVYGKTLTAQRSYFGSMAVAKMVQPDIDEFAYAVVYEGDTFKYGIKNGKKSVIEHEQDIGNVDKKNIVGAYAIALNKSGDPLRTEIMTMEEITQAWMQSKMNPIKDNGDIKENSTHGKFTADMAQKTVVNKLCKAIVNASSDKALLLERMNRAEDLSDRAAAEAEIEEQANAGELIDITGQDQEKNNQETAEEMAPGECPNSPGTTYKKSHCDKECADRKGCPAWPEDKKEAARKTEKKGPGF